MCTFGRKCGGQFWCVLWYWKTHGARWILLRNNMRMTQLGYWDGHPVAPHCPCGSSEQVWRNTTAFQLRCIHGWSRKVMLPQKCLQTSVISSCSYTQCWV
ncbi:hypothetical protein KC19_10G168300 [Ceratodon purpureus]|uniref:Uncharacterized protein n=1 Tax=Ceratodon purpureus TaxID=3225 RepID=A0A8T0GTI7_CERPU|nr:hypothetical protein KC19_10G168300 [Ceratodon purpureus]